MPTVSPIAVKGSTSRPTAARVRGAAPDEPPDGPLRVDRPRQRSDPAQPTDASPPSEVRHDRVHPLRHWSDRLISRGQQPWPGLGIGLAVTGLIAVFGTLIDPRLGRSVTGFLLVVPVVVAAVIGGRWPSYVVAVVGGLSYSLRLPPIDSPRVAVAEDIVALLVLLGVGLLVSTLVTGRIDALTRLDRDRSFLLRSVSHDLRTPLGTIRAAATDLLDESADEVDHATRRHLLHLIDHDAQRLDRLVANLLSLSRIEAGGLRPSLVPTDLGQLVRSAARRADRLDRRVRVHAEIADDLPLVAVDPIQLDQVVTNLVDNAVRHSPEGSTVEVTLEQPRSGLVELSVSDRGLGVNPEEAALIFQPFRSGQLAGSSGVGLAICQAIVAAHGGTIDVHDRPGGGARFAVRLDVG